MWSCGAAVKAAQAWMRFAIAYQGMALAAAEVILRRSALIATGSMRPADAAAMVFEKATALASASEQAAVAAARGGDVAKIASAALRPYAAKTRANVRRLRR